MSEEAAGALFWILEQRPRGRGRARDWKPVISKDWIGWRTVVEAADANAAIDIARDRLDTVRPEEVESTAFEVIPPPHPTAVRAVAECCWAALHGGGPRSVEAFVVVIFADDFKIGVDAPGRCVPALARRAPQLKRTRESEFEYSLQSEFARLSTDRIKGRQ